MVLCQFLIRAVSCVYAFPIFYMKKQPSQVGQLDIDVAISKETSDFAGCLERQCSALSDCTRNGWTWPIDRTRPK